VTGVAFSPDGELLAFAFGQEPWHLSKSDSLAGTILLWDLTPLGLGPNSPPQAAFTLYRVRGGGKQEELEVTPTIKQVHVYAGELLIFDASSSIDPYGEITEYAWDWESDGEYDVVAKAPLRFKVLGVFEVTLRVTDDRGAIGEAALTIKVLSNSPPVAKFTVPEGIYTNVEAAFDAAASYDPDGEIVKYEWDFDGDGVVDAEGQKVEWTFTEEGTYKVILIVTNDDGATARKETEIQVEVGGGGGPL